MERRQAALYSVGLLDDDGWCPVEKVALDGGPGEHARVRVQTDDAGRLEIRELHLLDNGTGITAARLRAFNFGTVEQMIGAALVAEQSGEQSKRRRKLKKPASRGYSDAFYEQVAAAYMAAPKKQVAAIAAEADVPPTTAARWVKQARKKGKLPAAPGQGKGGVRIEHVRIGGARARASAGGKAGKTHAS